MLRRFPEPVEGLVDQWSVDQRYLSGHQSIIQGHGSGDAGVLRVRGAIHIRGHCGLVVAVDLCHVQNCQRLALMSQEDPAADFGS